SGTIAIDTKTPFQERVTISITDTGDGISPEKQAEIFEPFNRLGWENSTEEGTGIGLTISKQLIELMNGSIMVDSRSGEGTCFTLELPGGQNEDSIPDTFVPATRIIPKVGHREKFSVLYVEDNPQNQLLVEEIFRNSSNIKLQCVAEAKVGLQFAQSHRPDLILMDLQLPDLDGASALRNLKNSVATQNIPVIAISANAMKEQTQKAKEAGALAFITKPINVIEFLEVVNQALKQSKVSESNLQ
ncbi:MAG: response regulator, partial [Nitrospinales bacterium]